MTYEKILVEYIKEFMMSTKRKRMLEGEEYFLAENKTKLNHAFMSNMVEEKVQYLLGNDITIKCEDNKCSDRLLEMLGSDFQYNLQTMAYEASNKGIAWSQVYVDEKGLLKLMPIPSEQICPIWVDRRNIELEALMRIYDVETYEGTHKKMVTHVELYEDFGVTYYLYEEEKLVLDAEKYLEIPDHVEKAGHYIKNGEQVYFGTIPFIWVKNNRFETNDLQVIKTLIDDYNVKREEVSELLNECRNFIYSIRNYFGDTDNDDIVSMLQEKRRIFVDDDGGVEILTPTIDITAAETHYKQLKEDITMFGKGVQRQDKDMGNAPSGIALKFMYSGLDLKCNGLEREFKFGFNRLIELVNAYLFNFKEVIDQHVEIIFNRDITINQSEAITDAKNSMGVISKKTIIANHPWVSDLQLELEQVEAEEPTLESYTGLGGEDEE